MKRLQFETFFAFHHLLIFWFALLLAHGPVFYRWATAPLALYALERLHRQFFRGKKVALLRFRLFGDVKRPAVFALEFENARSMAERNLLYRGSGLYLNCPHVTKWEWHPFTISSAPDDRVLTVNIRVMPDAASWTSKCAATYRSSTRTTATPSSSPAATRPQAPSPTARCAARTTDPLPDRRPLRRPSSALFQLPRRHAGGR